MTIKILFHQMEPSLAVKNKIEKKLKPLERNLGNKFRISWNCSLKDGKQRSDVHVYCGRKNFHATSVGKSLYKTIDDAVAKLKRQVTKTVRNRKSKESVHYIVSEGV